MGLDEADDAVRNASAIRAVKNVWFTDQLASNKKLLIVRSADSQKGCAIGVLSVDTGFA